MQHQTKRLAITCLLGVLTTYCAVLSTPLPVTEYRTTGALTGVIRVRGDIPELPPLVRAGADVRDAHACAHVDIPDESFLTGDGGGLASVFVYLLKQPEEVDGVDAEAQTVTLRTTGCRFSPHASIARAPAHAHFPHDEGVVHNPRVLTWERAPITFSPGDEFIWPVALRAEPVKCQVPIPVRCDIHRWMRAWILPLDHPYAAVTDSEGRFEISGLPPGQHEFRFWHERVGFLERELTINIRRDEDIEVNLEYPVDTFFY